MPHIIVKLYPGMPEANKVSLTEEIVQSVIRASGNGAESVSVAFVEVPASAWPEEIYLSEILNGPGKLYKKPGYKM
jgi:4-oxalocrotonate tautomerase